MSDKHSDQKEVNTDFEREKLCYEQNFLQARSLNTLMNQIPVLAMTLTGGLWYAVGFTNGLSENIKFLLLLFAGICNIILGIAVVTIRDVFESYLEGIKKFHPPSFVKGRPTEPNIPRIGKYSLVNMYLILMIFSSFLSCISATLGPYWPFEDGKYIGFILMCEMHVLLVAYYIWFGARYKAGEK